MHSLIFDHSTAADARIVSDGILHGYWFAHRPTNILPVNDIARSVTRIRPPGL